MHINFNLEISWKGIYSAGSLTHICIDHRHLFMAVCSPQKSAWCVSLQQLPWHEVIRTPPVQASWEQGSCHFVHCSYSPPVSRSGLKHGRCSVINSQVNERMKCFWKHTQVFHWEKLKPVGTQQMLSISRESSISNYQEKPIIKVAWDSHIQGNESLYKISIANQGWQDGCHSPWTSTPTKPCENSGLISTL